jgi:hypothetical protein
MNLLSIYHYHPERHAENNTTSVSKKSLLLIRPLGSTRRRYGE